MMNFSDELYHYGVKGMKWGVITKKDDPKSSSNRSGGKANLTDDGGTAYLNSKRQGNSPQGKPGSYAYNESRAKRVKEVIKNYPINTTRNGKKESFLGSNGLPKSKDDAHQLAMVMASERIKSEYEQNGPLPSSYYDPMMKKITKEYEDEILSAMEWENKGKPKALKEFADKGRDKTNDLIPKLKRTLKEVGQKISAGIAKAKAKIEKALNIKDGVMKITTRKRPKTQSKAEKALNVKDGPTRRTPLGMKDWEKIIKSNKK